MMKMKNLLEGTGEMPRCWKFDRLGYRKKVGEVTQVFGCLFSCKETANY